MEDIDVALIKKRALTGVFSLASWQFLSYVITAVTNILLWLFIKPQEYGVYVLVTAIIAFLNYFSDIGLASALIQKKESLNDSDLRTTFTIQQILVFIGVIIAFSLSYFVGSLYKLSDEGVMLFRMLIFGFFLANLKTIPSVLLERKLNFQYVIIPQFLESLTFNSVLLFLAWKGFGVSSYTWAVFFRGLIGVISIYILSPWIPSFGISVKAAGKLFRFGIPFQINSFLGLVKDDLLILFLGSMLSLSDIGLIGVAKRLNDIPLRMFMDTIIKVTFPAFARVQHSSELLAKALQTTLFGLSVTIFPFFVTIFFVIGPITEIVPKYSRWEPALLSFYFFVGASIFASLSTPLTNIFNAVGKIKTTMKFMILWVLSTWVLTVVLINKIGFHGYALAVLIVAASTIYFVVRTAKIIVPFNFWRSIKSGTIGSVLLLMYLAFFLKNQSPSVINLIFILVGGIAVYSMYLWYYEKERIAGIINGIKK